MLGSGGEWRFPVLPMLCGVNTSVKRWVTAQCDGFEGSAAHLPTVDLSLYSFREVSHSTVRQIYKWLYKVQYVCINTENIIQPVNISFLLVTISLLTGSIYSEKTDKKRLLCPGANG